MKGNHEKARSTLTASSVAWALARAFSAKGKYGKAWATLTEFGQRWRPLESQSTVSVVRNGDSFSRYRLASILPG